MSQKLYLEVSYDTQAIYCYMSQLNSSKLVKKVKDQGHHQVQIVNNYYQHKLRTKPCPEV